MNRKNKIKKEIKRELLELFDRHFCMFICIDNSKKYYDGNYQKKLRNNSTRDLVFFEGSIASGACSGLIIDLNLPVDSINKNKKQKIIYNNDCYIISKEKAIEHIKSQDINKNVIRSLFIELNSLYRDDGVFHSSWSKKLGKRLDIFEEIRIVRNCIVHNKWLMDWDKCKVKGDKFFEIKQGDEIEFDTLEVKKLYYKIDKEIDFL